MMSGNGRPGTEEIDEGWVFDLLEIVECVARFLLQDALCGSKFGEQSWRKRVG